MFSNARTDYNFEHVTICVVCGSQGFSLFTGDSQMLSIVVIYSTITRSNICVARTKISIILSRGQNEQRAQMPCTVVISTIQVVEMKYEYTTEIIALACVFVDDIVIFMSIRKSRRV